jgi:4-hydroxy-3-polyprenylbenzoate decarboxylase
VAEPAYDGLRSFLARAEALGEVQRIAGADWDLEIGALTETVAELITEPPALLFDEIKGYPKGFRLLSLPTASAARMALALGLPPDTPRLELLRDTTRRLRDAPAVPPREVADGPVMQNVMRDNEVDLWRFPSIKGHRRDGGRYIGTGCSVFNRDPDTGWVNMATYRMQVHERNLLGLWHNPGQQGRTIAEKYWKQGKPCPVAATFGGDFLLFMLSYMKFPYGVSELDRAGGVMGHPVDILRGPVTGLPIPAHAEIAIEGEIPPPEVESRDEGPFGEYTGYYAGGTLGTGKPQPVIRVKAVYYRNDPIILNMSPQWPGAPHHAVRFEAGALWDQLQAAGVPGITGVFVHSAGFTAISIEQRYQGHDRQVGMAALGCAAATFWHFIVVVDDDIDVSNLKEVMWAITTRCEPAEDIQLLDGARGTPMDPRMDPERKAMGKHTSSRAVIYATRPYRWRDKFPPVNRIDKDQREAMVKKYKGVLPFPD